jgi:hypothetical protein
MGGMGGNWTGWLGRDGTMTPDWSDKVPAKVSSTNALHVPGIECREMQILDRANKNGETDTEARLTAIFCVASQDLGRNR